MSHAQHANRTKQVMDIIDQFPCIKGWKVGKLLGVGTIGTVVMGCKKDGTCAAMKVQVITDDKEMESYRKELENQKAFASFAPEVYGDCIITVDDISYGVIVMQLLGDELDKYLMVERSPKIIDSIGKRISSMLEFMKTNEFTHADTCLYNIAYNGTGKDKQLVMLDFDRASTKVYAPEVDTLRLQVEMCRRTQSQNTKYIHPENLKALKKFVPDWHAAAGTEKHTGTWYEVDDAWVEAYEKYCRLAGIKCLT